MKHLLIVILLVVTGTLSAQTTDGIDAKITRLLELSGAEAQFLGVVDNMLEMQQQQSTYSAIPKEWFTEFSRDVHENAWQDLLPKLIEIYRNNYTEAEIDHQLAYLEDPVTQQLVAKQPAVMQQSMQVGQQWGMELAEKINRRMQEQLDKN